MLNFTDIHTHKPGIPGSILSIPASDVEQLIQYNKALSFESKQYYSIQLHPWHIAGVSEIADFERTVTQAAMDPLFVAIGECGLDSLCQTPMALQCQAFHAALELAHDLHKPVIIHCVHLWADMMSEVADIFGNPAPLDPPLIIHGFRKGPALAQQLLNAGFSISLGQRYNPEVLSVIPTDRLYHETDIF